MSKYKSSSRSTRSGNRLGGKKHYPARPRLYADLQDDPAAAAARRSAQLTVCDQARSRADAELLLEACGLLPGQEDAPWMVNLLPNPTGKGEMLG